MRFLYRRAGDAKIKSSKQLILQVPILPMMMRYTTIALVMALVSNGSGAESSKGEKLFVLKVQPLLKQKCFACHGGDEDKKPRGGFRLTTREGMLKGGDSGEKVLIPGNGNKSLLYRITTWSGPDFEMPPKESDKLTKEQTWLIRDWINEGAPWPDAEKAKAIREAAAKEKAKGILVKTSGGLSEEWTNRLYKSENLWAYQPVIRPDLPPVVGDQILHPIDTFIQARLEKNGIEPAPLAGRRMLIRRATFNLLGLPPTPEEVGAFVTDPRPDAIAYEQLIDRLLASPHYGEQWGRHWLDVARYADSAGFANDYERPNAWRYRDYVIRAFNRDKPYDQFIREQIAGDEINPKDPEMLIATGFLRMGPWEQTGMSVAKITRQQFLDDVTDIVGQVFLSHPLQCARCHDHKFDPIPTRDYYSIQAIFATTQFADRDAAFLPLENQNGFEQEKKYLQQRIQRYQKILNRIHQKQKAAEKKWYADRGLKYAPRNELMRKGVAKDKIAPRHIGLSTQDFGMERIARKGLIRHRWELDRFRPIAFSVYSGATPNHRNVSHRLMMPKNRNGGTLEQTAILAGGSPFSPKEKVSPGPLSAIAPGEPIPKKMEGRRLAFANWIASPKNPLTARSIVNRVWQYHFGKGLAENPNNFGAMGKKPSHPELLDWLAARFVEEGWSIKKLHRWMMTSAAYRRSSRHPNIREVLKKDPQKTSYAFFVPRRLEAEEVRDAMLVASGEWNSEMGGLPIRPEINLEAALQPRQIMGTYAPAYQPSALPEQRHRRSIYAVRIRGLHNPFLEVLNQPGSETSCERREASTVTPQVFAMFNSRSSHDRALAMAAKLLREETREEAIVEKAFQRAQGRLPLKEELEACLAHWRSMVLRQQKLKPEAKPYPKEVVRHAVEEMNGEPFSFVEELEVYKDFVPDLKPWDVGPKTRALADLCLVLLCSNEFLYVP